MAVEARSLLLQCVKGDPAQNGGQAVGQEAVDMEKILRMSSRMEGRMGVGYSDGGERRLPGRQERYDSSCQKDILENQAALKAAAPLMCVLYRISRLFCGTRCSKKSAGHQNERPWTIHSAVLSLDSINVPSPGGSWML